MSDVDIRQILLQLDELLAKQKQQIEYPVSSNLEASSYDEPQKEAHNAVPETPENPVPDERHRVANLIQNITNSLCAKNPDQHHESLGRTQLRAKNLEASTESLGHSALPQVDIKIRPQLGNEATAPVQPVELAVSSVSTSTSSDHHTGLSESVPGFDRCPSSDQSDALKLVDISSRANTGNLDAQPRTVATRTFCKLSKHFNHRIVFQTNRLLPEPPAARELQPLAEGGSMVTSLHTNRTWIKSTRTDRGPHQPWSPREDELRVPPDPGPSSKHFDRNRIHHPANLLKGEM